MENTEDFEVIEDFRQSKGYAQYLQSIKWQVVNVQSSKTKVQIFLRKFLGLKIAKIQRTNTEIPWKKVFDILKTEKVFSLRYEPLNTTPLPPPNLGGGTRFAVSSWPLLGTKTLRVNLRPTLDKILSSFKKDCRYALRKCSEFNVQCSINQFDNFYNIWKREAKRKRLWIPSFSEYLSLINSFGKKIFCLTYENLGGVVVVMHKKTAFYYYSTCSIEGKQLQLPYFLVWEAMKLAKKKGCTVWDFEGIYDDRWPNTSWKGFTHFKKSFGGKEIEFPGSFQKWLWPW